MVQINGGFDPSKVEDPYQPIPEGTYPMMITGSKAKQTAKGGQMIVMEFTIFDGKYEKRKVYENLNIVNASEKAVQNALITLKKICDACGYTGNLNDTAELHNKTFAGKIKVEESNSDGKTYFNNRMVAYLPLETGHVAPAQPNPQGYQTPAPAELTPMAQPAWGNQFDSLHPFGGAGFLR